MRPFWSVTSTPCPIVSRKARDRSSAPVRWAMRMKPIVEAKR
jgi:hypothetical protein